MLSQQSRPAGHNSIFWRIAVLLLISALFLFLAIQATDRYHWSNWAFGDAQTMLSLRQWHEDGWIHNYLLFKPQGYSPVVDLLDTPDLRQHAHGIFPGSSPRVGPRLWYTHYPPGYLIPFATFYDLGLDNIIALRLLAILFSLVALCLMYLVFERITSAPVAFLAVLFYGLSPSFLGYADSLANMPLDDLFRFAFMYTVVVASQAQGQVSQRRWLVAAWFIEFALSLSSFDSVFFVYAWLIGWDVYQQRGFRWKVYLVFALAPLSAHGIQVLQNIWYLGLEDAITDLADAFICKHGGRDGVERIRSSIVLVFNLFNLCFKGGGVLVPAAWLSLYLGRKSNFTSTVDLPPAKLLFILMLSGIIFPLILPHAGGMSYETRQFIPLISLAVSGISWMVIIGFRDTIKCKAWTQILSARNFRCFVFLVLSGALLLTIWINFANTNRTQGFNYSEMKQDIDIAERLNGMPTSYFPVFFSYQAFQSFEDPQFVPGYPQISPLIEFYLGSKTILCVESPIALAQDITKLIQKTDKRFSLILVTRDIEGAKLALSILAARGIIKDSDFTYNPLDEIFAFDLTNFVDWTGRAAGH
jgi:hypothetical protein